MKIFINPQPQQFPVRGGVKEHLRLLYKFLSKHVEIVNNPYEADILHTESTWDFPNLDKPKVYVCHGGFIPDPIPIVLRNLSQADVVITVAEWVSNKYFPQLEHKTIHIPNGVDWRELSKYRHVPRSNYILYAKEWNYYLDDFKYLVRKLPEQKFKSIIWTNELIPPNLDVIGLQTKDNMMKLLRGAQFLLLSGSEVCPTMLLEAWGLGTPVLAKNIDGNKEIILKTGTSFGLYDSVEEAVEYISLYDTSKDFEFGMKTVKKNYAWENIVKQYVEVYEKLL